MNRRSILRGFAGLGVAGSHSLFQLRAQSVALSGPVTVSGLLLPLQEPIANISCVIASDRGTAFQLVYVQSSDPKLLSFLGLQVTISGVLSSVTPAAVLIPSASPVVTSTPPPMTPTEARELTLTPDEQARLSAFLNAAFALGLSFPDPKFGPFADDTLLQVLSHPSLADNIVAFQFGALTDTPPIAALLNEFTFNPDSPTPSGAAKSTEEKIQEALFDILIFLLALVLGNLIKKFIPQLRDLVKKIASNPKVQEIIKKIFDLVKKPPREGATRALLKLLEGLARAIKEDLIAFLKQLKFGILDILIFIAGLFVKLPKAIVELVGLALHLLKIALDP